MDKVVDTWLYEVIVAATVAEEVVAKETIQGLWSGYGSLDRYSLVGSKWESVIVKHVHLPDQVQHPRGWNTDLSHQRKLRSYQVEAAWYQYWAGQCGDACPVASALAVEESDDGFVIVLEDLESAGYPVLKNVANWSDIKTCLKWLAHFHATFMSESPKYLWPAGTYWHLDTRPDELIAMEEGEVKRIASELDKVLNDAPFQTFVHGDAKLANFCFSVDGRQVAGVDFQYVGGGCGMKDVAYFISSCLDEEDCERLEAELLNVYFAELSEALILHQSSINPAAVERAWRPLYAVAWTDFYRFLKGWSPEHWKINSYSDRLAQEVVLSLKSGSLIG